MRSNAAASSRGRSGFGHGVGVEPRSRMRRPQRPQLLLLLRIELILDPNEQGEVHFFNFFLIDVNLSGLASTAAPATWSAASRLPSGSDSASGRHWRSTGW